MMLCANAVLSKEKAAVFGVTKQVWKQASRMAGCVAMNCGRFGRCEV